MRRSFRTHEWGHPQTQGVALGWYASPLQGESKYPNARKSQRDFTSKPKVARRRLGEGGLPWVLPSNHHNPNGVAWSLDIFTAIYLFVVHLRILMDLSAFHG
jgi:hypothetical protein